MSGARFEAFENVITKQEVSSKVNFNQIAYSSYKSKLGKKNVSLVSIKQIDKDTIQILKRVEKKRSFLYSLGFD